MFREMWVEYTLIIVLIAIVAAGVFVLLKNAERRAQDQAACIASGRAWVVDHYEHGYILVGKVLVPTNNPVYACVEQ